ncbi:MAG: substrate-binding domain-containing protein [Bacteroidales bacterium]
MKNGLLVLILLSALCLFACNSNSSKSKEENSLVGNIKISGAYALYPMVSIWAEEFQKLYPKVKIDISKGGAGKGIADVLSQKVDLGMISRKLTSIEREKSLWTIAVAKDAVVVTINSNHLLYQEIMTKGLSQIQLYKIFISGEISNWKQLYPDIESAPDEPIHVYTRSDDCGAGETFANYLNRNQKEILGFKVGSDPAMAAAVEKDIYGIGYNNIGFAYDRNTRKPVNGIAVVPLDINRNHQIDKKENIYTTVDDLSYAIKDGVYPMPPARVLCFVSKGQPNTPLLKTFLKYVLGDGQLLTHQGGFVALSEWYVEKELEKLH